VPRHTFTDSLLLMRKIPMHWPLVSGSQFVQVVGDFIFMSGLHSHWQLSSWPTTTLVRQPRKMVHWVYFDVTVVLGCILFHSLCFLQGEFLPIKVLFWEWWCWTFNLPFPNRTTEPENYSGTSL